MRKTTLPQPWSDLARHVGGVGVLAEMLGVSRRTIQMWGKGRQPSRLMQEHVSEFAKKYKVTLRWRKT